jgi:hypothetical protein
VGWIRHDLSDLEPNLCDPVLMQMSTSELTLSIASAEAPVQRRPESTNLRGWLNDLIAEQARRRAH